MNVIQARPTPLDSRQLNAFVSLARTGSFKETAAELCLTQSAISHAMSALEKELGCRLLGRLCKKVVLTEMGEALLHHAEHGLKELAKARETLDSLKHWGIARLRVGAGAALMRALLPAVMAQARLRHPRLQITARVVRPWEVVGRLAEGELDLVLGEPQKTVPGVSYAPLFHCPLGIIAKGNHRWVGKGAIPPAELAAEPCVLTSPIHPTRQLIDRHLAAEKIRLNPIAEVDSFDTIKEWVKAGSGIGVLPRWAVREELAAGGLALFPLGRKPLNQSWGIYRWENRGMSIEESTFHKLCRSAAEKTLLGDG